MPGRAIRAIIFDIGRVLVRVDLSRATAGLSNGASLTTEELWAAIEKDPRWRDWQEGRMTSQDWQLHLCRRFGLSLDFEQFASVWNSVLVPEPVLPNRLLAQLSKRYRLGLLSNTDPMHVAQLESSYDFFRYFPQARRIYSCSAGCSKPGPLIYRRALRACKVRADEAVYIDDLGANVEAARGLGMSGIHFQAPEQLHDELSGLGVEINAS